MPELDKAAKFNRKAREEHPSQPCLDIDVAALTQCVRVCPRVCRNPFFIHVFKTAFRFACPISKVIYQPHLDCEPSGRTCSKQISRMRRRPLPRVFDSKAPRLRRDIGSPLILPAKAGHSLAVHQLMAVVIDNTGVHLLCIQVDIAVVLMHTVIESHRSPPCVVTYWITRRR